MWPFTKKKTKVCQSGILQGFTDWHSHLLPGVDDGVKEAEESLAILQLMEENGVRKLHFTPHVMEDVPNKTQNLRTRYDSFSAGYKCAVETTLATENMLDSLFVERLKENDFLPLTSDHLLVETSFISPPMGLHDLLSQIESIGYYPVLAHPERYRYMETEDYRKLLDMGVRFQLNVTSLAGFYGPTALEKAKTLLESGAYRLAGLDIHSLNQFKAFLNAEIENKVIRQLEPLLSNNSL